LLALKAVASTLALKANEIVFYPLKETREGNISIENLKTIIDNGEEKDLVVVGGGFSLEEEPQRLINILVSKITKPLIIDADGLSALKDKTDILIQRTAPTVLTPHLGEMSRLCGKSIDSIKKDSVNIAREFATKFRVILVLKDARTIIAYPNGEVYINLTGNFSSICCRQWRYSYRNNLFSVFIRTFYRRCCKNGCVYSWIVWRFNKRIYWTRWSYGRRHSE